MWITLFAGNPSEHVRVLRENTKTSGELSLQNSLELARNHLRNVPSYGTREIVVIYGSLTTSDPGNVFEVIKELGKDK